jgi:hypothetical protein
MSHRGDRIRDRLSYYQQAYSLASYSVISVARFCDLLDFFDKDVLELGGWNLPPELTLNDCGARSWTCVDMIGSQSGSYQKSRFSHLKSVEITDFDSSAKRLGSKGHLIINGDATKLPDAFSERFDIVISSATLEHVLDIPTFLAKCHSALKQNGAFMTRFGPLWSCRIDHHAYVSNQINFHDVSVIGEWGHLLLKPTEMMERILSKGFTFKDAAATVEQVYTSSRINRIFAEEYKGFFSISDFTHSDFQAAWAAQPSGAILEQLRYLHPKYSDFSTGSWQVVASR